MVYFVGAGSGAADLITVRGMHMLQQADVIIYAGSLVNPELLQYAKTDCEIHNSAKLTLEEVLQIMQEAQEQGKMLVRLHTGEPSIYGAVREQMDALDALHIPYESCPGVSACYASAGWQFVSDAEAHDFIFQVDDDSLCCLQSDTLHGFQHLVVTCRDDFTEFAW